MKLAIYGARSLALGTYLAIRDLYPEYPVVCFLVTSRQGNPATLANLPIREAGAFFQESDTEDIHVLIGTPEDVHGEIILQLEKRGFFHYTCMDSYRQAVLMERYFLKRGEFLSIHNLEYPQSAKKADLQVAVARFYKDRQLRKAYDLPSWTYSLQAGAVLTDVRVADFTDHTGENISEKNGNYCELTALYWIWKNRLAAMDEKDSRYLGLFQYRRILDLTEEDQKRMQANDVDVILPFPTLHEPDMQEHHARYVKEPDWEAMLQALQELRPEYAKAFWEIAKKPYLYNYNVLIAKHQVLSDYCAWLFPILKRTEEISRPRGWERSDRYIGYLGENLMTLYFLFHQKDLKICHTGCRMLI